MNVIVGKFSLYDFDVYALIDPGSTHSYISTFILKGRDMQVETTEYDVLVTNSLGRVQE